MNRCYILGAGFSKEFGLPLASELTQSVFNHAYPSDFWQPQDRQNYMDLLKRLYPQCDLNEKWPDFEDLITILEEWEDYRVDCKGGNSSVSHFRNVLLKHLELLLCEKINQAYSKCDLKPIREFVMKVKKEQSPLISFNWDLLIEVAAHDLGHSVTYSDKANGEIRIAKPHGSLNLAEVKKDQYERMKNSINMHSLDIEWERGDEVVVREYDPLDAANRIVHTFKKSLFVPPNARKSYTSKWIKLQWHRALDIVRKAQEIIVIGYSLPDTDVRPRILMRLAEFGRHEEIRLKLIDPEAEEVQRRYRECIRASIDPVSSSWSKWLVTEKK